MRVEDGLTIVLCSRCDDSIRSNNSNKNEKYKITTLMRVTNTYYPDSRRRPLSGKQHHHTIPTIHETGKKRREIHTVLNAKQTRNTYHRRNHLARSTPAK